MESKLNKQKKIIIIGAGLGGLSAACYLAKQGYQVQIFEKNSLPGGRLNLSEQQGFKFDMGPSWYMMPEVFERFFADFGKSASDYYQLKRLDPSYRVVMEDGTVYDISAKLEDNVKLFESIEPGAGKKLVEFLNAGKFKYDTAMEEFLDKDYRNIFQFFRWKLIRNIPKLKLFASYHNYVAGFFKHPHLQKLTEWMTTFLGSSPYNAPALYSLITHADYNLGIYYPMGGMYKLVEGIVALAEELGVEIICDAPVDKIEVIKDTAKSVHISPQAKSTRWADQTVDADFVISNADLSYSETKLLDRQFQTYPESYWSKTVLSPSSVLFYIGLNKKLSDKLLHHTLVFAGDWKKGFAEIFDRPQWPSELLYYVSITSKSDNSVAPAGHENVMILMPLAAGLTDTPELREQYYQRIMDHLEKLAGEKIRGHEVYKNSFAINDFEEMYNSRQGHAFGLAHTLPQSALFRPKNWSAKVSNLYYTGCMTNPGIGVPLSMISGKIAAAEVQNNHML